MNLKERMRQAREEAILEAAQELMAAKGYAAMTMDGLAEAVGVSKATLYQHFPAKEEIALRVVLGIVRTVEDYMASLQPTLPAAARLEQVARKMIHQRFSRGGAILGGTSLSLLPIILADPRYREEYGRVVTGLSALVEEAKAAGDIAPHVRTRVAVQALVSVLRDPEYDMLLAEGLFTVEQMTDDLTAIIFHGIRKQ